MTRDLAHAILLAAGGVLWVAGSVYALRIIRSRRRGRQASDRTTRRSNVLLFAAPAVSFAAALIDR